MRNSSVWEGEHQTKILTVSGPPERINLEDWVGALPRGTVHNVVLSVLFTSERSLACACLAVAYGKGAKLGLGFKIEREVEFQDRCQRALWSLRIMSKWYRLFGAAGRSYLDRNWWFSSFTTALQHTGDLEMACSWQTICISVHHEQSLATQRQTYILGERITLCQTVAINEILGRAMSQLKECIIQYA